MNKFRAVNVVAAAIIGCAADDGRAECAFGVYQNQFSYRIEASDRTASGIAVDRTGQPFDLGVIDRLTDEVESCLASAFGQPSVLREDTIKKADCAGESFDLPVARSCFSVKIPDDYVQSCDGLEQLLPVLAPAELCRAKGLEPTAQCPCRWRAGIQNYSVIVSVPALTLYKEQLIRLVTGCNNPWKDENLAVCATSFAPR